MTDTSHGSPLAGRSGGALNLPNLLTIIRILLVPVFVILFIDPTPIRSVLATLVFLGASLTDFLDGYLARRWGQVTKLGKLLDPIADKILILSALVLLVDFDRVPAWIAIVLIGREIAVTGLRAMASTEGVIIPAEIIGKYKLAIQVAAIVLLILGYDVGGIDFPKLGMILLWISMFLSVSSAIRYGVLFGNHLQKKGAK